MSENIKFFEWNNMENRHNPICILMPKCDVNRISAKLRLTKEIQT